MKLRPTVFFAGDCALEARIIYGGVRGGAPRRGGRGRRSAHEGEASPLNERNDVRRLHQAAGAYLAASQFARGGFQHVSVLEGAEGFEVPLDCRGVVHGDVHGRGQESGAGAAHEAEGHGVVGQAVGELADGVGGAGHQAGQATGDRGADHGADEGLYQSGAERYDKRILERFHILVFKEDILDGKTVFSEKQDGNETKKTIITKLQKENSDEYNGTIEITNYSGKIVTSSAEYSVCVSRGTN